MLDETDKYDSQVVAEGDGHHLGNKQLSLFELFFMTTLVACSIALYQFVSPLLALLGGGITLVVAAVRWTNCENPILSGLVGFAASMLAAFFVIGLGQLDEQSSAALIVVASGVGYLSGATWAFWSNVP